MDTAQILALIRPGITHYSGYPATKARLPYVVARPLLIDFTALTLDGGASDWDYTFSLFACGGSVDASFNLAKAVVQDLHGARLGDTTLACSVGYVGAEVEGHYETQVTVQLNQGGL